MELDNLVKLVVQAYAKKHNISEEQALALLEPILNDRNKLEELYRTLKEAEILGETFNNIPDEVKPIASRLIDTHLTGEDDDMLSIIKEARKLAIQLKIIDYVLGTTLGGNKREEDEIIRRIIEENERLRRENEELKKSLEKIMSYLEEQKKKSELEALRSQINELAQRIESIKRDIQVKIATGNTQAVKNELDELANTLEKFVRINDMLKRLGAINEAQNIPRELLEKIRNPPSNGEGIKVWLDALDRIIKLAQMASKGKNSNIAPAPAPVSKPTVEVSTNEMPSVEFKPLKPAKKPSITEEFKPIVLSGEGNE